MAKRYSYYTDVKDTDRRRFPVGNSFIRELENDPSFYPPGQYCRYMQHKFGPMYCDAKRNKDK